jgi:hypothetical protein
MFFGFTAIASELLGQTLHVIGTCLPRELNLRKKIEERAGHGRELSG